jgi:hypothetical protein
VEVAHDFSGDVAGNGGSAALDVVDGFEQHGRRARLDEIPVCAGFERTEDALAVFVNREHHDLRLGQDLLELSDAFDAVHAGQIDVHEDDLGFVFGEVFEGGFGAVVMAQAAKALGAVQHAGEGATQLVIVFDD